MRWAIAGLLFALTVALAIATAAIRADNVCARKRIEQVYRAVEDRRIELQRLSLRRLELATPQHLADLQMQWIEHEAARRAEAMQ